MTKTKAEIEDLKVGWLQDSCWDIESTEDFEDHREELLAFRLAQEAKWEGQEAVRVNQERQRRADRAAQLGVPGAEALVLYLEHLERRIATLDEAIEKQSHYIDWRKQNWHE